jgi:hypothetical protein
VLKEIPCMETLVSLEELCVEISIHVGIFGGVVGTKMCDVEDHQGVGAVYRD